VKLSRPSIANIISGLVRKGYILEKAYVVNETKPIICIGGANVDRKFYLNNTLEWKTSNPIRSIQSPVVLHAMLPKILVVLARLQHSLQLVEMIQIGLLSKPLQLPM